MTGEGTKENPYIVENVTDFCSITSSGETYYKLKNNIDFNDHPVYSGGIYTAGIISAPDAVVDLNGKFIKNIVYKQAVSGSPVIRLKEVSNGYIENFVIAHAGADAAGYGFWHTTFKNVSLNVELANGNLFFLAYHAGSAGYCSFENSVITIGGAQYSQVVGLSFNGMTFRKCCINFDDVEFKFYCFHTAITMLKSGTFNNSYFTGTIKLGNPEASASTNNTFYYNSNAGGVRGTFDNCYFAIRFASEFAKASMQFAGLPNDSVVLTTCFCDFEILKNSFEEFSDGKTFTNIASNKNVNFYPLSTTECKSVEKLRSIGFLAAEV